MSCNVSNFNLCFLIQNTFKSPVFDFGDLDISNDSFIYRYKSYNSHSFTNVDTIISENTVYIKPFELVLGSYIHEMIWERNGITELVFQGTLTVKTTGESCLSINNSKHINVFNNNTLVKVNYSERIVNNFIWSGSVLSFEVNENMELVMNETIPTVLDFGLDNGFLTIK